jgi:hypothetical protein
MTRVKIQQSLYWTIAGWRGFLEVEAPRFPDIWHMKVIRFSALHTVQLYTPPGIIPYTHFVQRLG